MHIQSTSTSAQVKPKPCASPPSSESRSGPPNNKVASKKPINTNSAGTRGNIKDTPADHENTSDLNGDRGNVSTMNDVESLRNGIIKTSNNNAAALYTIVLVGETGVGKSSVVELIANILAGNDIDHYTLDHTNLQSVPVNQSRTSEARLYRFTSKNGVVVRILDMPGLGDTRDLQQAGLHMNSIATEIQKHIDHVTAVLILANGTVPRGTGGLHLALSTLFTAFPKSLANNIAFMFTNVPNPLCWNFCQDTIPVVLKGAPQFRVDNPVALQGKFSKLKDDSNMNNIRAQMHTEVKDGEQGALEMLVSLFDWLDSRKRHPTTEVVSLHEKSQNSKSRITELISPMDQATATKAMTPIALSSLLQDVARHPRLRPIWKRTTRIGGRK